MYNQFYPYMQTPVNTTSFIPNATRSINPTMGLNAATRANPLSLLFKANKVPTAGAIGGVTKASTFTFSGFLNGASKTLNVINQAIPVFNQVKPIYNNARTMYRIAKEINSGNRNNNYNSSNNYSNYNNSSSISNNKETSSNSDNNFTNDNNGPNFFV